MKHNQDPFPEFLQNLEQHQMVGDDSQKVLLAVSGGPDSMALLHLFFRWNPSRIGVWHLNHGFRPAAAAEAEMVRRYCQDLGVPVQICCFDVTAFIRQERESKQQGARRIRYQLLEEYARDRGYDRIALGHHADDQAETILMHFLRGSGLSGLKGMLPKRGMYIRPLLTLSKEVLVQYCVHHSIPFAIDESNVETVYLRNKVRHELIPLLEKEYNPGLRQHLLHLSEIVQAEDAELESSAERIAGQYAVVHGQQVVFPRKVFAALSPALQRRVLRRLWALHRGNLRRLEFEHAERWRWLILSGRAFELELPQTWAAGTTNHIYVGEFELQAWDSAVLPIPGEVEAGSCVIRAEVFSAKALPPCPDNSEDFALAALAPPLVVRPRQEGDRMVPFGGSSPKKVSRLMVDAHVPRSLRDYLPVVCDQADILWIPEVKRAEKGRLSAATEQVVRLTCGLRQTCR